jgi:hypothetical protein
VAGAEQAEATLKKSGAANGQTMSQNPNPESLSPSASYHRFQSGCLDFLTTDGTLTKR